MAVVVFDDNGGGGDGVWSTNTNWIGDALPGPLDDATISADCALDMDDAVAAVIIDATKTLTINDTRTLTATGNVDINGTLTNAAGSGWTCGGITYVNNGAAWYLNGTAAKHVTVTGGGQYAMIKETSTLIATYVDSTRYQWRAYLLYGTTLFSMVDCDIDNDDGYGFYLAGHVILKRCFIHGCKYSGILFGGGQYVCNAEIENTVFGYKRDGTLDANASDNASYADMRFDRQYTGIINIRNVIWTLGFSWNSATNRMPSPGGTYIENVGHITSDILPDTGSALDGAVVGPGIGHRRTALGTVERSTSAKKTGDYGERMTPDSLVSSYRPLESSIYIPISTGDNISVSVYGRRHTMTNDCAEIEIDPEGAWFTPTIKAVTLTIDDTWYEFATAANCAEGPGIGGSGGSCWGSGSGPDSCGMVRIVLRLKEYQAAAYFDWADMVVTIT